MFHINTSFPFKRNVCSFVQEAHPRPSAIVSLASRASRATSWVSSSTWRWNTSHVCPCFESPCHGCPCHDCSSYACHLLGHLAHLPHLVLLHLDDHLGSPATMSINIINPQTDIINYIHHQKEKYSLILKIVKPCHRPDHEVVEVRWYFDLHPRIALYSLPGHLPAVHFLIILVKGVSREQATCLNCFWGKWVGDPD